MIRKVLIRVSVGALVVATMFWAANRIGYLDVRRFPCYEPGPKPHWYVSIRRGRVRIFNMSPLDADSPFAFACGKPREFAGFGFQKAMGIQRKAIWFPTWPIIVIFTLFPGTVLVYGPLRRHRRRKKGLCIHCGYNLTGNVSGVCPECGEKT